MNLPKDTYIWLLNKPSKYCNPCTQKGKFKWTIIRVKCRIFQDPGWIFKNLIISLFSLKQIFKFEFISDWIFYINQIQNSAKQFICAHPLRQIWKKRTTIQDKNLVIAWFQSRLNNLYLIRVSDCIFFNHWVYEGGSCLMQVC